MGDTTSISWADKTFNAWWGCTKVGPGCDHCYAETFDKRVGGDHWGSGKPRRLIKDWSGPRKWQREAERTGVRPWVFAHSMSDVLDNEVPDEWRARLWDLARETPLLRWIFVTKRIGNAAKMLPADWPGAFQHCGLVSTICNQEEADRDVPKLLATPAAWRGISAEPLLGPLRLWSIDFEYEEGCGDLNALTGVLFGGTPSGGIGFRAGPKLDWIIVGGESGPGARPMNPQWARDIRDQCAEAGAAFHFKQNGEWVSVSEVEGPGAIHTFPDGRNVRRIGKKLAGRTLDGIEHNGTPPAPPLPYGGRP